MFNEHPNSLKAECALFTQTIQTINMRSLYKMGDRAVNDVSGSATIHPGIAVLMLCRLHLIPIK